MATTVGTLLVNVIGDASGLASSLNSAERQIERFGSRLFFLGSRITAGITLPMVGFAAAVNKIGSEFDQAMTESLAIMDDVSGEMRTLMEQRAVDISKSSKFAAKDIAAGYYDLASAGLTAQETLDSIGSVAQFAQAGLMDMGKAGEYLAGATAALTPELVGVATKSEAMARVADVLTHANNKALGTIEDFASALTNKMAPAMRIQNMSLEDGVAMLMVYAEQNIRGKAAGQQAYMALRDLQSATSRAGEAWKEYGISVFDAGGEMRRLPDILDQIQMRMKGFSKNQINEWLKTGIKPGVAAGPEMSDKERADMWKDLKMPDRSRASLQYLLGFSDRMREFSKEIAESSGATAEVAAKQAEAMAVKWEMALHRMQAGGIKLYNSFKPILIDLFDWLGKAGDKVAEWADKFNAAEPSTKKWVLALAAGVAAIGPAIATAGSFILMLGGMSGGLATLAKGLASVLEKLPTIGARMAQMGVAGSTASKLWAALTSALSSAVSLFVRLAPHVAALYGIFKILEPALGRVLSHFDGMGGKLANVGRFLSQNLGSWEQWKNTISNALSIVSNLVSMAQFGWLKLVELFDTYIIPELGQAAMTVVNTIGNAFKGLWNAVSTVFNTIISTLPPAMVQAFSSLFSAVSYIVGKIVDVAKTALGWVGGIIAKIGANFLPKELVELGRVFADVATNSTGFHDAMARAADGLNTYVNSMGMVDLKARNLQGTFQALKGVMTRSGVGMSGQMPQIPSPLGLGDDDTGTPTAPKRDPVNEAYLQLMGEGKKQWQDMSAAFKLHRSEIVQNEDAMKRLWDVYKGVRGEVGPNGLTRDLDKLFEKEIGIEQFEQFRASFGAIWDDMVPQAQNSLEPFLGLINQMALESEALIKGSGVGGSIFSPEFFKKHGAAIEELAMTYNRQPAGIRAMIDSYKQWDKAITDTDKALRLHQLNMEALSSIYGAHADTMAKLEDAERDLDMLRMTAGERALKGIQKNAAATKLEFDRQFAEQANQLKNLTGVHLEEGIKRFLAMKEAQDKILEVTKRADLERVAASSGANELIVRSFKNMSDEAIKSIIKIQLAAKDMKALYGELANGFNTLAGVFDKEGDGWLTWLGKMSGLMGEATQSGADMRTAVEAMRSAFKGGEFDIKNFAAAAVAGFAAAAQAVSIMDRATQSAHRSQRIMGGMMAGAQIGSAFGPWGTAIGAVGGALVGAIRKSGAEEEMKRIAKSFGVEVSEELAKAIDKEAKELYGGNRQVAEHMNLGKILEEGGGLSDKNLSTFMARMHDTFTFMEQGLLSSSDAMEAYSDNFATFADFITSRGGDLATAFIHDFRTMGDMMKKGAMSEGDFLGFLDKNFSAFVTNMEKSGHVASRAWAEIVAMHADMGQKSEEMMAFLGGQATTAGSSWAAAVKAVTFDFEDLGDEIEEAKKKVDDLTKELKEAGGSMTSPELEEAMANLDSLLGRQKEHAAASAEQMNNLSLIILSTFNAAVDSGLTWSESMEAIGPSIDALIEGYETLGIETDNAGMKALIAMRSMYTANQQLFDGIGATTQGMIALSKLGGLNAETFRAIGDSMVALFRRTQSAVEQAGGTHIDALRPFAQYLAEARHAAKEYGFALDETTQEMIRQAEEMGILGEEAESEAEIMERGFQEVTAAIRDMIGALDGFIGRLGGVAGAINSLPQPNIQFPDMPDYTMPDWQPPDYTMPSYATDYSGGGVSTGGSSGGDLPERQEPASAVTLNFNDAGSLDRARIEQEYVPIIIESVRTNRNGSRTDLQDALGV